MSCDHRVVDGAIGAEYLKALRDTPRKSSVAAFALASCPLRRAVAFAKLTRPNLLGADDVFAPERRTPPPRRDLRLLSFALHATRGLLRDQSARRKAMFWTWSRRCWLLSGGATFSRAGARSALAAGLVHSLLVRLRVDRPRRSSSWRFLICSWCARRRVAVKRALSGADLAPREAERCRLTNSTRGCRARQRPAGNGANKWRRMNAVRSRRLPKKSGDSRGRQFSRAASRLPDGISARPGPDHSFARFSPPRIQDAGFSQWDGGSFADATDAHLRSGLDQPHASRGRWA